MEKQEKNRLFNALIYPVLFVLLISLIHFAQYVFGLEWSELGIYPRRLRGLKGIIFAPLIHSDYHHLLSNSVPILILGTALFYFYKKIALRIVVWVYFMVGVWTWVSARQAYHIGASGVLYGIFSFLLVSGFLRRDNRLIALSFFVIMFYGSMVWGIFPIKINVSFEGHLWGFVAGVVLALYYRKQGPQKAVFVWDEDEEEDDENAYWKVDQQSNAPKKRMVVKYTFKPKDTPKKD